jgi:F-type H+-transporting ATPase subunit gamma
LNSLIPRSLRSKIYAVLLDSAAAEQAARTVAMQIATDNADEILDDLTIQYNKQRQQAITSELLDIIGGSEALK